MHRLVLLAVAAVACSVTVAVGLTSAATTQTRTLKADAGGAFKFNKTTLRVSAGKLKVIMRNPSTSGLSHAIAVEGKGIDKDGKTVSPGGTSTVTVTLRKGRTYEFYCPVGSHESLGMKGKIRVS